MSTRQWRPRSPASRTSWTTCRSRSSYTIVITATPQQYDWDFGDGEHTFNGAQQDVTHTYANTGTAHVTITWTGTFVIDGGARRDVIGTATTTGPGTPLHVKQARAELVTG